MSDAEWEDAYRMAWENLLHARAYANNSAQGRCSGERPPEIDAVEDSVVHSDDLLRRRPPARRRRIPKKIPTRPTAWHAAGKSARILPATTSETIVFKMWGYWSVYRRAKGILKEVLAAPDRLTYTDPCHRSTTEERIRGARSLPCDRRRPRGAGAEAPRGCDPHGRGCAGLIVDQLLSSGATKS